MRKRMAMQKAKTQIAPSLSKISQKSQRLANFQSLALPQCKSVIYLTIYNRKAPKLTKKSSAGVVRVNHENLIDP